MEQNKRVSYTTANYQQATFDMGQIETVVQSSLQILHTPILTQEKGMGGKAADYLIKCKTFIKYNNSCTDILHILYHFQGEKKKSIQLMQ